MLCSLPASAQGAGPCSAFLSCCILALELPESLQAVQPQTSSPLSVHIEAPECRASVYVRKCVPGPEPPGPLPRSVTGPAAPMAPQVKMPTEEVRSSVSSQQPQSQRLTAALPSPSELWKENVAQLPLLILVNKIWNRDIKNELCGNYTPIKI